MLKLRLRVLARYCRSPSRTYCAARADAPAPARRTARLGQPFDARHREEQRAHDRATTPARPSQFTLRSTPWRMPTRASDHDEQLARGEQRERPARQQLEVPADDRRPRARAAGRRPGRAACRGASTGRSRGRRSRRGSRVQPMTAKMTTGSASVPSSDDEREHQEDGDQREPDVADRVRDRPRVQRLAGARLGRRRPGAVEPREPAEGEPGAFYGRLRHRSAAASAAPSSGRLRALAPAPHLHLDLAGLQRAPPDGQPQRHAEQLGVGELRARAGVAVVVEHVEPGGAQLLVEPVGEPRARRVPALPRPTSSTSNGAIERGHEMPCSSANCSTAAAAMRAGPMP